MSNAENMNRWDRKPTSALQSQGHQLQGEINRRENSSRRRRRAAPVLCDQFSGPNRWASDPNVSRRNESVVYVVHTNPVNHANPVNDVTPESHVNPVSP